ncbi:unnamed protein product [Dibothriocephalus latus]|uniref:Uncharacterized protein n=1 Tax=Dibothriocephalus latus TaxID=60516 RepID=A0A3P7NPK4_DIBLA|nr:unnamed protein product [Dibothriocephalus latus]
MSWVVNLAEKGGTFLNTLDGRVAELLKADEKTSANRTVQEEVDRRSPPLPPSSSSSPAFPSSAVSSSGLSKPEREIPKTQ